jgi:hypothetical protein
MAVMAAQRRVITVGPMLKASGVQTVQIMPIVDKVLQMNPALCSDLYLDARK